MDEVKNVVPKKGNAIRGSLPIGRKCNLDFKEDMPIKFIRVTKDNESKDRGFIAIDAICSAFENSREGNVSIMTMDGFWYDVVDDIEKLWDIVNGNSTVHEDTMPNLKARYFKKKKMMPLGLEKMPKLHSRAMIEEERQKIPRPIKNNDLPASAGGGQKQTKDSCVPAQDDKG